MTMHEVALVPSWTLADRLRKARELSGLSTVEFAARMGVSRTTVTNYEHGYRIPRRVYLRAWAETAGVDHTWLRTGTSERQNAA